MADVERLLSEYIAEHRAGGRADPLEYLERVEGTDRAELAELIDAYLRRSPGREWDPEAFEGSAAERLADGIARSLQGASGWWPMMLPRLRDGARLTRGQLVERLSAALGVAGREEKVRAYYHEMEHGTLPSAGVSQRVLDALAEIFGGSAETLREIGAPLGEGRGPAGAPAMARVGTPDPRYAEGRPGAPGDAAGEAGEPRAEPVTPAKERDEIDEMFTGGP
ncbi:MAG: hypothetical protein GEU88_16880 [Solirubrobacterales bacterium]|nr:hypothetical protein [Solirubrobacterales bacterium]